MTTFGDQVYQYGGAPVSGLFTTGQVWFIKPSTGDDGASGKKPSEALKTWARAHTLASADKNDIIYVIAEDNSASGTTDYQSSTLTLSKDGVHYVGVNSGGFVGQRSRIAQLSTATGVAPLVTWSGSNGSMRGIHIFHGVNDATSKTAALSVTGERNYFFKNHIAGIGHATMDVTDNCSLQVSGGAENHFDQCYLGLDTIARGTAANSEIRLESSATRNLFTDCVVATYAEAAGHQFVLVPTNGLDRWTIFKNTMFVNMPTGDASGTTMTEAFDVTGGGSPDGIILLENCSLYGATDWEAAAVSGKVMIRTDGGTAATAGLTADVAAA